MSTQIYKYKDIVLQSAGVGYDIRKGGALLLSVCTYHVALDFFMDLARKAGLGRENNVF